MGKIIRKRVVFSGSSNRAENIVLDDTTNVKQKITEIQEQMITGSDVVDNLLSESANLPLSANQGRLLKEDVNNLIKNGGSIPLLNGAVGTLGYIKLPYEMYLIFGYVKVTGNKWFANFPAVPSTLYPNQDAKIIGIDSSGTPCSININSYAGMTMPEDEGEYWINGIIYAPFLQPIGGKE